MTPCATQDQLERFLRDQLEERERETVADHLDLCVTCQGILDRITRAPGTNGRELSDPARANQDARMLEALKAKRPTPLELAEQHEQTVDHSGKVAPIEVDSGAARDDVARPSQLVESYPAIDGFRIIREVGRGGMGVVYEAEEERLSRRVALKVLPASSLLQPKQVQRFEREARAAARLHHTNIVPVFGSGHHVGYNYYFMQYIEGRGFDAVLGELRRLRQNPSSSSTTEELSTITERDRLAYRSLARIGLQVALALDHAHGQGVLHRDIKPSNLLLDTTGNVWVTDFGLAKTLEAEDLTSTGDVLGTIRYMAPERFAGRCDARSDLYSLGLTLYELVALRPAYEAADRYELIERMRRDDPILLRQLDPRFPRDLETMIHKLIAREPARRYGTAAALAADLRRFLEDRPVQARPASPPERALRWCRRNPWVAAFLLVLALGTIVSTWQAIRATAAGRAAKLAEISARLDRNRADVERDRAQSSHNRAVSAIHGLLGVQDSGDKTLITEETRQYRNALIDAGMRESQELVRELENDSRAQFLLVQAYDTLARTQNEGGDSAAAIATTQKGIAAAQALFDREHSITAGRSLGAALQLLGTFTLDREASLSALRRSTAVFQRLLADHPDGDREQSIQMIGLNHYDCGHRQFLHRRYPEAVEAFLAARTIWQASLDEYGPSRARSQLQAKTELYLCRAYHGARRPDNALVAGRRAIDIYRALVHDHPQDFDYSQQLNLAYQEVSFIPMVAGRTDEAVLLFEEARRTLKQAAASHGQMVSRMAKILADLAQVDYNVRVASDADIVRYAGPRRAAISEAYEICDKLSFLEPLSLALRKVYADACLNRAFYQEEDGGPPDLALLRKAERLWEVIGREDPRARAERGFLVIVRRKLAEDLTGRGENEEASRWRSQSLSSARGDPGLFYEIALEYVGRLGPIDHLPTKRDARRQSDLRRQTVDDTIAMLREAVADGFRDAKKIRGEPAFEPIRSTREFRAIVSDLDFPRDPFARP